MVAAVAVHAAALASWPQMPGRALLTTALDPTFETGQPEWIFMDQALAGGAREGPGVTRALPGPGPVQVDPATIAGAELDEQGLSDALRDRLVRATSFAPTLSDADDPFGIPVPTTSGTGTTTRADSPLAGLTAAEQEALQQLSALDLERLAAIRPDVALEAMSNWVLVRNPDQVRSFIFRHSSRAAARAGSRGAVSVAIWVSAAGSVEWAEIVTSSGRSEWDELALELFSDVVVFRPARLEGLPMPMSAIFTVDFPW